MELYVVFYANHERDEYEFVYANDVMGALTAADTSKDIVGVFEASQFSPSADTMNDIWERARSEDPGEQDIEDRGTFVPNPKEAK